MSKSVGGGIGRRVKIGKGMGRGNCSLLLMVTMYGANPYPTLARKGRKARQICLFILLNGKAVTTNGKRIILCT